MLYGISRISYCIIFCLIGPYSCTYVEIPLFVNSQKWFLTAASQTKMCQRKCRPHWILLDIAELISQDRLLSYCHNMYWSVNSLIPSDAIWQHRSKSALAQVWLVAWRHQAITRTNVDLSSVRFCGVHVRTISQEIPQPSITKISLKSTYLKFHSNFSGANE